MKKEELIDYVIDLRKHYQKWDTLLNVVMVALFIAVFLLGAFIVGPEVCKKNMVSDEFANRLSIQLCDNYSAGNHVNSYMFGNGEIVVECEERSFVYPK